MDSIRPQTIGAVVAADDLRAYVQRVYAWMVGGLITTSVTAWVVYQVPALQQLIFGTPLMWVVLFAPLIMVFILSSRIDTMKPSTAAGLFIAYSLVNGLSFSMIFMLYELGSIFQVFGIAAGMYGAAACYGYFTKRDLTGFGSFLFMGLIGLILAMIVNYFLGSSVMEFAISVIGVLIFTGLTAYDMNRLRNQAIVVYAGEAAAAKRAILTALSLYLNFLNIFLFLLRLLGSRR